MCAALAAVCGGAWTPCRAVAPEPLVEDLRLMIDFGLSDPGNIAEPKLAIGLSGTGDVTKRIGIGLELGFSGVYAGAPDGRTVQHYSVIRTGMRAEFRPLWTDRVAPFLLIATGSDHWLERGRSRGAGFQFIDFPDHVGSGRGWSAGAGLDVIAPDASRGRIMLRYNWSPAVDVSRDYLSVSIGFGR